ncbi:hypothetical protein EVAR_95197_1 [Eumeta japonica]|uniref:Uncharacterized protein n=1 Tax=Eumeta variegata TaxID=151549 RepID=A0A4C1VHJ4_EUMVA|nr:hypothetical protein EVAR_95197_1 [Eumeta japonica]
MCRHNGRGRARASRPRDAAEVWARVGRGELISRVFESAGAVATGAWAGAPWAGCVRRPAAARPARAGVTAPMCIGAGLNVFYILS